jgi:hypothetical protein
MKLIENIDELKSLCRDGEDHTFRIYQGSMSWEIYITFNALVDNKCWYLGYDIGDFVWASDVKLLSRTDVGKALTNKGLFFIK